MCLQFPYANHGAGIWIPTFALVQNHPNDARGRQMEEADKQMALLQAHRSWRQNSTQKWGHQETYGNMAKDMEQMVISCGLMMNPHSYKLVYIVSCIWLRIYISTINLALTSAYWTATSLTNALELDAQHVVGSKPGVHAYWFSDGILVTKTQETQGL